MREPSTALDHDHAIHMINNQYELESCSWCINEFDSEVREAMKNIDNGATKMILDIDKLGEAIHNLQWCKINDVFHDLAHGGGNDTPFDYLEHDYRKELVEAYNKIQPIQFDPTGKGSSV